MPWAGGADPYRETAVGLAIFRVLAVLARLNRLTRPRA